MSGVDDVRRAIQDISAPDLKSLHVELKAVEEASKLRDLAVMAELRSVDNGSKFRDEASKLRGDALSDKIDRKFELVVSKMEAHQAMLINALN